MQRYKLDFRNKNFVEQLTIFAKLLNRLDALPVEKRDPEYLETLRVAEAAARASQARIASLRSDLKSEISRRKTLFDAGRLAAQRAGVGALLRWGHSAADVLATGLDLPASNKSPVGLPAAPTHFRAGPTDSEGEAQLRWQRTVRRCTFEIEWHTDPPDAEHWHRENSCTKAKCRVPGLVSGAKYWFRVRATNAHGASAWSQMASVRVK